MRTSETIRYYSQKGFRDFILEFSKNRELVPRFNEKFSERPQTFKFDAEIINVVRQGVTSFHASEERWTNPLTLSPDMDKKALNELRQKWDLIFDVDTKVFEYAKICAKLIIDALEFHEIKNPSVKFSGGNGFHIGIAFNKPTKIGNDLIKDMYPEAPRIIGSYLQELIKEYLRDELLAIDPIERISEKTKIPVSELMEGELFNPLKAVNIDPVAISSRHLIRAPYSLNEKKWLVSVPLNPKRIREFSLEEARPEKIDFKIGYLDTECDATELFRQAFDWHNKESAKKKEEHHEFKAELPKNAVNETNFPPCINRVLAGLVDGRKRALFSLIHFLHKCGYSWPIIRERALNWNEKNNPPLRTAYVKTQIEWAEKQGGLMPSNCNSPMYKDIGVCYPDGLCTKIKNPVTYALHKHKMLTKPEKKAKKKATKKGNPKPQVQT